MSTSSRFSVAVHILTLLQAADGAPVASERIASSASTNPAVIRRLLCMLARAGITTSQLGAGGGALLARRAEDITLLDVYRAVEEGALFAMHHKPPNPGCSIGRHIQVALEETTGEAVRALETVLAGKSVADMLSEVRAYREEEVAALHG
jgi:Rrf2 family protein